MAISPSLTIELSSKTDGQSISIADVTVAGGAENMDKFFQAPIGRNAKPDEMGDPLILLNSDAARFISGHLLIVDWGYCGEVDVGIRQGLL